MNAADRMTEQMNEVLKRVRKRNRELDAQVAAFPGVVPCRRHPRSSRVLDPVESKDQTARAGRPSPVYRACPVCQGEEDAAVEEAKLRRQGVPEKLLHCHLTNWTPANAAESAALVKVQAFGAGTGARSFLLMFGGVGLGKSHLAVGLMRGARPGMFVTHTELLRRLRASYRDAGENPVRECQDAGLLVLDDLGVSGGGRDEAAMLYEVLAYRSDNSLRTVLTVNVSPADFCALVGVRLWDRLQDSVFALLQFTGKSHRGGYL